MILFTILALTLIFLIAFVILLVSVGGALFTILFGDVIVCAVFIVLIMIWLVKRKNKKRRR